MDPTSQAQRHAEQVARALEAEYPEVECALVHRNPLELLVATILSAQCTDQRVNLVTPGLFARWGTAADLASAPLTELEQAIQSTGFFRNKAKNIQGCCQQLVAQHAGQVPQELDSLVQLPGVGRKTANVLLGTAFGIPSGVVVDTHVTRLSRRLGLTRHTDAVKIERDLMALLPQSDWIDFSHRLIWHGRRVCQARKPKCDACCISAWCPRVGVAGSAETKGRESGVAAAAKRRGPAAAVPQAGGGKRRGKKSRRMTTSGSGAVSAAAVTRRKKKAAARRK